MAQDNCVYKCIPIKGQPLIYIGLYVDDLGFDSMAQDNCVYKCTPITGQPPIYVGLYVDNLVYYSKLDKVEEWFENQLESHVKVDFMGDAS